MTTRRASTAVALALIATAAGLAQCDRVEPPAADAPAPAPRSPQTTLSRADIVAALAHAGSNRADADPMIAGRTFEVKLPFGCDGPDASATGAAGLARWAWSPDRASIRLTLTPDDLTRSPLVVRPGQTPAWDSVEGYWIARPWLADDICPPTPAATAAAVEPGGQGATSNAPAVEILRPFTPPPSPQTSGMAVVRGTEASRLGRRAGEAYSFVVRSSGDRPPGAPVGGYRLILAGRISAFPDGRAIRCTSESPDRRPVCLAAVELDRVAFEDASGARLSEWRPD